MSPRAPIGGDERVRTADPLLAKQVLSQLSYTPMTFAMVAFSPALSIPLVNVLSNTYKAT